MKANKIVSGVLALTMVFGSFALPAQVSEKAGFGFAISAEAATYGDYKYDVLDDGTVEITEYIGGDSTVIVPETIKGKKVTRLGDDSFAFCSGMDSIIIPDSITSIGDFAFYYSQNLSGIIITDSLKSLGKSAFKNCTGLTDIELPDGITSISENMFDSCTSLKSIAYSDNVTTVGKYAFANCPSLKTATVGDGVREINESAFYNCKGLTEISVPDSVTRIADGAFEGCTSLSRVFYSGSEEEWKAIEIGQNNGELINADIRYNYDLNDPKTVPKVVTIPYFSCTDNAVRINWNIATNATGYRIYRYNPTTKKWNTAKTISGGQKTTYRQGGLNSGTTYKFKVKAYAKVDGVVCWGEASDTMTTTTTPSMPVIKSYSSTTNAVRINWTPVTGATGYRIYRYNPTTKRWDTVVTIKGGSANTYRDGGRKANTSYQYKVKAYRKVNDVNYWGDASLAKTCKTK